MELTDWSPLDIADLRPLAEALARVAGTQGEAWVTVQPAEQPLVEKKGLFGRGKSKPAEFGLSVAHSPDAEPGVAFVGMLQHPEGAGVPQFPGLVLQQSATDTYLTWSAQLSADDVAAQMVTVVRTALGPACGDRWRWRTDDSAYRGHDATRF